MSACTIAYMHATKFNDHKGTTHDLYVGVNDLTAGRAINFPDADGTLMVADSSTGDVQVTGTIEGASDAEIKTSPIRIHSNTINTNTTVASTENAVSGGPVTIASGVTVTVSGDWTVV